MTGPTHSPLPWRLEGDSLLFDAGDVLVLTVSERTTAIANARLIVAAVNSHAALLAAAKSAANLLDDLISAYSESPSDDLKPLRRLESAIEHAEEPAP